MLPFDSSAVVLSLKGREVSSLFDYVAGIKAGEGAFPQVSTGIHFTLNRLTGECEDIRINGQPIDPDKTYRIVTNSYLASGGDGYKVFLEGFDRFDSSTPQRDTLVEYIKHLGGRIKPKVQGRIRVISGPESADKMEGYSYFGIPLCGHADLWGSPVQGFSVQQSKGHVAAATSLVMGGWPCKGERCWITANPEHGKRRGMNQVWPTGSKGDDI
jgi:hypothetical protein